jgi:Mn2+/Fe2+ NRAMP family transporter
MKENLLRDQQAIEQAQKKGLPSVFWTYFKLSGPGWLGSALTLGAGSFAGSLFLGVLGGYALLWIQPLAMFFGVVMLCAISYATLSIESSPFQAIRRHINPALAWSWVIGALLCNMAFSIPQYAMSFGAITENLFPALSSRSDDRGFQLSVALVHFVVVALITFGFRGKPWGVRIYEFVMRGFIAVVVISFVIVVVRLGLSGRFSVLEILHGFIPNWRYIIEPTPGFQRLLDEISNPDVRQYWTGLLLKMQRQSMIGAASSTVAVNMCFLIPYSFLARKYTRVFRGAALFDMGIGTLIPFIIVTGCIVIASTSQFHLKPYEGIDLTNNQKATVSQDIQDTRIRVRLEKKADAINQSVESRVRVPNLAQIPVESAEWKIASTIVPRDNYELANSLVALSENTVLPQKIFGVGMLAMTCGTLSLLMLVSGFAVCELLGVEHKGLPLRLGIIFPAFGILWPFILYGSAKSYLAVIMPAIAFTLLPIAYITFFIMMNSKRLLGEGNIPRGTARWVWNILMGLALLICGGAALFSAWHQKLKGVAVGRIALIFFVILNLAGYVYMKMKQSRQQNIKE